MRILLARGAVAHGDHHSALLKAAGEGHSEIVELLLQHGADVHYSNDAALVDAAMVGHVETAATLLAHGADISADGSLPLNTAIANVHVETVALFLRHGGDFSLLMDGDDYDPQWLALLANYAQRASRWNKTCRISPPAGLYEYDPTIFKPALFKNLQDVFRREGYSDQTGNRYAYQTMALFQSEERVLQYLKKWGKNLAGSQPLHDVVYAISLPKDLGDANLNDWGDAVLKHGPEMAKLVKFCDRLPSPVKSDDGKTWSYAKTRAAVAKFAYSNADEHPALAALCFEYAVDEHEFETALKLTRIPKSTSNIPEITIDGARFGMQGAVFKRLANDDVRGLFLGEMTDCCQSIGKIGSKCAMYGFASENGGFFVVENSSGDIIGQSWAWRGKNGELCLDSIETLGERVSAAQWKKLLEETALELTTHRDHDITALHVGMGGKTPKSLSAHFTQKAAKPVDYTGYRDSNKQIRVWKR